MSLQVVFLPAQMICQGKQFDFTTNVHQHQANCTRHSSYNNLMSLHPALGAEGKKSSYLLLIRFHTGCPTGYPEQEEQTTPNRESLEVCEWVCGWAVT
jgi:hypothetical protein